MISKTMSIEEKAKHYDEALIRISRLWESGIITRENYEYIFPELAESEDEKIRKEIIAFLKENSEIGRAEETWSISGLERWIAWLEKQEMQKSDWNEEDEQYLLVCKNALAKYETTDKWDSGIISHWLENKLKAHQNRWEPSDEQMNAVLEAMNIIGILTITGSKINSLYQDLKKLRKK